MSYPRFVCFFLLSSIVSTVYSQSCPCQSKSELNICYLSREIICQDYPTNNCGLTFDNLFQDDGIVPKLLNQNNFGPNGIVDCSMNLIAYDGVVAVSDIENQDCDIFYVGQFPIDSITGLTDYEKTLISDHTLNNIYEWSVKCPQNLVIVSDAEANLWGYRSIQENDNPNIPFGPNTNALSIFDGPFGIVTSMLQNGYEAILTEFPATGYTTLVTDGMGRPSICLDHKTSDLVLSQIGFFSIPGAGAMTPGPDVINNSDRMACNIFALGCNILNEGIWNHSTLNICSGETLTLPSGIVVTEPGNYLDTITMVNGCDTIYNFQVQTGETNSLLLVQACTDSGHFIQIGNMVFNEQNPSGQVILNGSNGCDSIVEVFIDYSDPAEILINDQFCESSFQEIEVNGNFYNSDNPSGQEILSAQNGCDSIITIDLSFDLLSTQGFVNLDFCQNSANIEIVEGVPFMWNSSDMEISTINSNGCDSIIYVTVNVLEHSSFDFNQSLCEGDSDLFTINGNDYGVNNPQGQEIISNAAGCDSVINVFIEVISNTYASVEESLCQNSSDFFQIGNTVYDVDNPSGTEIILNSDGCDSIISVNISIINSDLPLIDSILFVSELENTIDLNLSGDFMVQWIQSEGLSCPDCSTPSYNLDTGLESYDLVVTDSNGCQSEHSLEIFKLLPPYIPNAFSPNDDSVNDSFQIFFESRILSQGIEITSLHIFDRWGNVMTEKEDLLYSNGLELWDGRIKGSLAPSGVYVYHLSILFANDIEFNFKGDLSLLR